MYSKIKSIPIFLAMLVLGFLLISLNSNQVYAGSSGGTGGGQVTGSKAGWSHAAGPELKAGEKTTQAWKQFDQPIRNAEHRFLLAEGEYRVKPLFGMTSEQFYSACQQSQFIWWYGDNGKWNTQIGTEAHPLTADKMPHSKQYRSISTIIFSKFLNIPNNGWNQRRGTVIVCSRLFMEPEPPTAITLQAKSGTFIYDGKDKTVNGYTISSGSLKQGDSIATTFKATGTKKAVGNHKGAVAFNGNATIKNGNTNVTDKYTIAYKKGNITILNKLSGANERCSTTSTESITKVVRNDITLAHGFKTKNSPSIGTNTKNKTNEAYEMTASGKLPQVDGTAASWKTWKTNFEKNSTDLSTQKFNLENENGMAATLMKHGGILNVTRTHQYSKVEVEICQPQTRTQKIKDGKVVWGNWVNKGKEKIKSVKLNSGKGRTNFAKSEQYSYQILGVNCNVDGVAKVKKDVEFETIDLSNDDGSASGLIQTKPTKGTAFPLGKSTHYTGKEVFYTPDGKTWKNSCKETFKNACVSKKLTGDVKNNANFNVGENPLFTFKEGAEHGNSSSDGELNFFRDNEDRIVRADVWYPKEIKTKDFTTYPGRAASATYAQIFGGTPEIEITTIAPWDNSSGKIKEIGKQVKWGKHINSVIIKSQWSSEKGKPYKLGLTWNYQADAIQNIPGEIDGSKVITKTKKVVPFDLYCQFMNDGTKSYDAQVPENPFTSTSPGEVKWDKNNSIKTIFTRSASDRRQE